MAEIIAVTDLPMPLTDVPREPGAHVSDIIGAMEHKINGGVGSHRDAWQEVGEPPPKDAADRFGMGYAWEAYIRERVGAHETDPLEVEEIIGSPDAYSFQTQRDIGTPYHVPAGLPTGLWVEEYKHTACSSRDFPLREKMPKWWRQALCYIYQMEAVGCVWRVAHYKGAYDYKADRIWPEYSEYWMAPTVSEVNENWTALWRFAAAEGMLDGGAEGAEIRTRRMADKETQDTGE